MAAGVRNRVPLVQAVDTRKAQRASGVPDLETRFWTRCLSAAFRTPYGIVRYRLRPCGGCGFPGSRLQSIIIR